MPAANDDRDTLAAVVARFQLARDMQTFAPAILIITIALTLATLPLILPPLVHHTRHGTMRMRLFLLLFVALLLVADTINNVIVVATMISPGSTTASLPDYPLYYFVRTLTFVPVAGPLMLAVLFRTVGLLLVTNPRLRRNLLRTAAIMSTGIGMVTFTAMMLELHAVLHLERILDGRAPPNALSETLGIVPMPHKDDDVTHLVLHEALWTMFQIPWWGVVVCVPYPLIVSAASLWSIRAAFPKELDFAPARTPPEAVAATTTRAPAGAVHGELPPSYELASSPAHPSLDRMSAKATPPTGDLVIPAWASHGLPTPRTPTPSSDRPTPLTVTIPPLGRATRFSPTTAAPPSPVTEAALIAHRRPRIVPPSPTAYVGGDWMTPPNSPVPLLHHARRDSVALGTSPVRHSLGGIGGAGGLPTPCTLPPPSARLSTASAATWDFHVRSKPAAAPPPPSHSAATKAARDARNALRAPLQRTFTIMTVLVVLMWITFYAVFLVPAHVMHPRLRSMLGSLVAAVYLLLEATFERMFRYTCARHQHAVEVQRGSGVVGGGGGGMSSAARVRAALARFRGVFGASTTAAAKEGCEMGAGSSGACSCGHPVHFGDTMPGSAAAARVAAAEDHDASSSPARVVGMARWAAADHDASWQAPASLAPSSSWGTPLPEGASVPASAGPTFADVWRVEAGQWKDKMATIQYEE
ncbi:hypothetical protein AMAG_15578 [Allomyces macrogynus ATCC 38327]|uniref:Uncharacterized protein n=1 Tax=Allomyces macrogynus (strain ATCC 38327) TaxID=578462 RepID=A0A0L0T958_ALLM3|nr:hypothetical protein AMAG_15578 [Allomyces macrogynus ATCC 38327]|eukprot:KNE71343.1 hypothetical protein AMAG_15578 [Allomyces macrogynus ATCC 38327]